MNSTAQLFESDVLVAGAPRRARRERRSPEDEFALQVQANGLPEPLREFHFAKHIGRRWRSDFCWPAPWMLIVEIEGLVVRRINGQVVVMGRHASITGFREDAIKYASAAVFGYQVLRFEQGQVKDRTAIEYTMRVLHSKGWKPDTGEGSDES